MDISKITDYLYVSSKLRAGQMEGLAGRNIHLVISMIAGHPPPYFSSQARRILWLQTCDSILVPIPMKDLMEGVQAAIPVIQSGQSVLVYCAKGRHRSAAMAAAILIAMGHPAREAVELIRAQRKPADPQAWHIARRIQKFEKTWKAGDHQAPNPINRLEETYAENATRLISMTLRFLSGLG